MSSKYGAGPRVFQVADELGQDPGLIGVTDRLVRLLHQRFGPDLAPRTRRSHHLIGDGQQGIELVLAGDIEVGLDLARDHLMAAGLDLYQRGPRQLPDTT